MEIRLRNDPEEMSRLTEFIDEFCAANAVAREIAVDLHVALDEQVANIIMHAYRDAEEHDITIRLRREEGRCIAEVEDDGIPFNPLDMPEPDTNAPLDDRRIGGLGIHIIKNLMDEVRYERRGEWNVLTIERRV